MVRRGSAVVDRQDAVGAEAVPVPVRVPVLGHQTLVHVAVAVVVHVVAEFGHARVDEVQEVVAVGAVGHEAQGLLAGRHAHPGISEAVPVPVLVPGHHVHGVGLVDRSVAVVVHTVAVLVRPRMDGGIGVVAVVVGAHEAGGLGAIDVGHPRDPVPVAVRIQVPGRDVQRVVLVCDAVAVVVLAVAVLVRTRVLRRVRVVAVGRIGHVVGGLIAPQIGHRQVAVGVPVGVQVPDGGVEGVGLVHRAVAVVVLAVAVLVRARVLGGVAVVAVVGIVTVAGRWIAGLGGHRRVAVSIAVSVQVPGHHVEGVVLVHRAVAVVVQAVAVLVRAGVDRWIEVVAVVATAGQVVVAVAVVVPAARVSGPDQGVVEDRVEVARTAPVGGVVGEHGDPDHPAVVVLAVGDHRVVGPLVVGGLPQGHGGAAVGLLDTAPIGPAVEGADAIGEVVGHDGVRVQAVRAVLAPPVRGIEGDDVVQRSPAAAVAGLLPVEGAEHQPPVPVHVPVVDRLTGVVGVGEVTVLEQQDAVVAVQQCVAGRGVRVPGVEGDVCHVRAEVGGDGVVARVADDQALEVLGLGRDGREAD